MLTYDQMDEWDKDLPPTVAPNPARPYIICPMGTNTRHRALMFNPGVRVIAVVRTRAEGEMLRRIGYEWADPKKPKHMVPMKAVVTLHSLPKFYPLNHGDYLIAMDWRMLADRKTKVHKVFAASNKLHRFCISPNYPHPWATWNVAKCLGVADRNFRVIHDHHAERHAIVGPNFINLREPDQEASTEILTYFKRFVDERGPQ